MSKINNRRMFVVNSHLMSKLYVRRCLSFDAAYRQKHYLPNDCRKMGGGVTIGLGWILSTGSEQNLSSCINL